MYFFFGDGELGNQLFQYRFITQVVKKKETICVTNFNELSKLIEFDKDIKFLIIKNKFLIFLLRRLLIWFFIVLSYFRVISSINVERKKLFGNKLEKKKIIKKKGLFNLFFIYPRFFQSEFFFKNKNSIDIKKIHLTKAKRFLSNIPKEKKIVFVHFRQGKKSAVDKNKHHYLNDYKKIKFLGFNGIALPERYYFYLINKLRKKIKNSYFVILSDNIKQAKNKFSYLNNKIISNNNLYVDLSIMSLCSYGIMSNSSISWWGGYLMKNRKIVFGPKYWLGWKRKIVFQSGAEPSFARLIDPNKFS